MHKIQVMPCCLNCGTNILKRPDQSAKKWRERKYCSKPCFNQDIFSTKNREAALTGKYSVSENSGCWVWLRNKNKAGYGILKYRGKNFSAHRFSFETFKGEIPEGAHIMHSCNNPSCLNPSHLTAGTAKQNVADAIRDGLHPAGWAKHPMKGVSMPKGKYSRRSVLIEVDGIRFYGFSEAARNLGVDESTIRFSEKSKKPKYIVKRINL